MPEIFGIIYVIIGVFIFWHYSGKIQDQRVFLPMLFNSFFWPYLIAKSLYAIVKLNIDLRSKNPEVRQNAERLKKLYEDIDQKFYGDN